MSTETTGCGRYNVYMKTVQVLSGCAAWASLIVLASGAALSQSQDLPEGQDPPDASELETGGYEEGLAPTGQHADHLHWSTATFPQDRFHADDLIGSEVRSRDDESVGQVMDLALDREGRILAVVVEMVAELGLGGRTIAVPWDAAQPVRIGEREFYVIVEMSQQELVNAPEYERE